jgi:uncharacterized SAM-dependent methyltransferase
MKLIRATARSSRSKAGSLVRQIVSGLLQPTKQISSQLSYLPLPVEMARAAGVDVGFSDVMGLTEYYQTRAEMRLLHEIGPKLIQHAYGKTGNHNLSWFEGGPGNGMKSIILLSYLSHYGKRFNYLGADISIKDLKEFASRDFSIIPGNCEVTLVEGDAMKVFSDRQQAPCVFLELGGNICNRDIHEYLSELRTRMQPEDMVIIGYHTQDPGKETILRAYDDYGCVTDAFVRRALVQVNHLTQGHIDHRPCMMRYDPHIDDDHTVAMRFRCERSQEVLLEKPNQCIQFRQGETVVVSYSRKLDPAKFQETFSGFFRDIHTYSGDGVALAFGRAF